MLLCGNDVLKQKTIHSSLACYVHVLLYNATEQMFMCLRFAAFVFKER
jgi:hypothetical protein